MWDGRKRTLLIHLLLPNCDSEAESCGDAGISSTASRYLSPHAAGLTPGPLQVLAPFSSLQALAFSIDVKDRRVSCSHRFIPQTGLSQLSPCPAHAHEAAPFVLYYGLRIWPTPLTGYDPRFHASLSRCRVGASSARMLPCEPALCLHTHKGNWCGNLLSDC